MIFTNFFKRFILLIFLIYSGFSSFAQTINGTVIGSDDKMPLIGASILVKSTLRGAVTDIDGKFSLNVQVGDTIKVEYTGFTTYEQVIDNYEPLFISLEEGNSLLSEVIVVGYSSKSRKELSAAVTTLDSEKLLSVTSPNVETMLQGQVAGLTVSSASGAPGAVADIRIRGITSINSDKPPLFVVDGMIGGTFVPNDVESLTVLKDAAAIGLFGSAGSAGVIIVNTKQGVSQKPTVSFSSTYGVKEAVTGNFSMMNGSDLYDAQEKMWGSDNLISFLSNRPEDLKDQQFDWLDAGFDRGVIQNYNLAVRGKSKDLAYGFSADYFDEEGTFINTNFQRLNLRGNLKFNVSDKLSFHTDVNAQFSQNQSEYFSWFEDVFFNMPWDNPYDAAGELYGPQYVTNPSEDWYGQFRRSFLYSAQFNELSSRGSNVVWSNRAKYDFTDWLSLETRVRLDHYSSKSKEYYAPNTDEGLSTSGFVGNSVSDGWGASATSFLRFNKSVGKHDFGAFVAHEGGYNQASFLNFRGQNLSSQTIDVASGASIYDGDGYDISFKGISYISEANYSLDRKYFATAYFRRDGSSLFAENTRFGNFYGGSLGWLVSEEGFLKDNKSINLLKLRLSYGLTGNSNIPPFLNLATYDITRQYNSQPAGEPNNPANPSLGWETTKMGNLGVDLNLLDDNVVFSVDVYQKSVEGMLLNNPLPFSSGYQSRIENIGDMRNRGIEAALTVSKRKGKFGFSSNLNFAYNQNEITKITDILDQQTVQAGAIQQINVVGKEAFQWYMPKWLGVNPDDGSPIWEKIIYDDNGQELERVETGTYSEATFQANGSALPTITGGFSNSFNYGNFGLSFLLTFQAGNEIYHYTREFVDSDGANVGINLMNLQEDWNRWENPGDVATHPVLSRGGSNGAHQTSSRYIESGDYLRLRNISLSYSLPEKVTSRLKLGSARFSISADNLKTFSNFSGMDPDVGFSVQAFSLPGLSYLKYPISRQYTFGFQVEF